jgi:NAD(P)-dependent dehydrogenase (short-subunit alcohol dehydrogenase family)
VFTYELAHRLWGSGVTANALHPGHVATNLGKNNAGFLKPLVNWIHLGGISPEEGARPILYLGCSPKVSGITGRYFVKEKMAVSHAHYDRESARLLWEVSATMAGIAH